MSKSSIHCTKYMNMMNVHILKATNVCVAHIILCMHIYTYLDQILQHSHIQESGQSRPWRGVGTGVAVHPGCLATVCLARSLVPTGVPHHLQASRLGHTETIHMYSMFVTDEVGADLYDIELWSCS